MIKSILRIILLTVFLQNHIYAEPPVYVDNLPDAISLSEDTGKDLFVVFGAEWCGYCVKMKKDISTDESILDDKIVCYIDHDDNSDLVKEYKVKMLPDYMVLRKKRELKRRTGYEGLKKLKEWLKRD